MNLLLNNVFSTQPVIFWGNKQVLLPKTSQFTAFSNAKEWNETSWKAKE